MTKLLPVIAPLAILGATAAPVHAQASFAGVPPLHTSGGSIVDSTGKVVRLTGLNWFGLDSADESLHGLWAHGMNWYLDNIVVKYGFNCLRVPYTSAILDSSTAHINYQVIDVLPKDIATNPSLAENTNGPGDDGIAIESDTASQANILITPLQELDLLVQKCQARGIYVILDQHTGDNAGQQDADPYSNPGQANWENDWVTLVNRYKNYSCVIGCDLHNEPHGISWATWQAEAQDCANKILAADPTKLVIVEGTDNDTTFTYVWWGGDLYDAGNNLVKPTVANQVVYSAHEYTTDVSGGQSYDSPSTPGYPGELDTHFTRDWGYLAINGIAPVLVGEFGTKMDDTTRTQWMDEMCSYIKTNGLSYTYWAMNPNSGDVGGLLGDNNGTTDGTDWNDIWPNKLSALQSCEFTGSGGGGTAPAAPTNLTAAGSTGKVTLSWTGSSGAASYSVFRGTTSGGEGTTAITTGLAGTSYTDTAVVNGTTYYYTVKAVNSAGSSSASNEASAKPTAPVEGPYGGTPWAIPGTVQAENYDTGGEGVAYHDSDTTNSGGQYRTTDGVDIEATTDTGGGYDVGWTAAGEWLKYTVNVASAGTYTVTFRVASASSGGTIHLLDQSGNNLTGAVSIPVTGGWQTWTNVTANVTLAAGQQVLELYEDTAGFNVNYMTFSGNTATAPSTPTGVTATAGNAQVILSWTASSGATSYNVYRSTSAGGEGTTAYKTGLTSTSFTDTGLTNGTTYYYKVAAVNSVGSSAQSTEASATPSGGTAPSTPTGLTATAGNAQVSLSWTAASGATSYNVYRSTSAGGEGTTAYKTGLTSTSFTDTGLTNGTTYYYKVAAVNSVGTSAQSTEASATPTGTTSGGPATITAGPNSSNSQWYGEDDLTLANSSAITAFTVSITVQKTSGLTYNGMYNTFGTITETHVDNGSSITYTYSATGVSTTSVMFAAQYNLSGTVHAVTGDTYSVTYTTGGVQYTKTGTI